MKIRELIERLQEFDPELDVEVEPTEGRKNSTFSAGIDRVSRAVLEDDGTWEAPGDYKTASDQIIVCIYSVK